MKHLYILIDEFGEEQDLEFFTEEEARQLNIKLDAVESLNQWILGSQQLYNILKEGK